VKREEGKINGTAVFASRENSRFFSGGFVKSLKQEKPFFRSYKDTVPTERGVWRGGFYKDAVPTERRVWRGGFYKDAVPTERRVWRGGFYKDAVPTERGAGWVCLFPVP